MKIAGISRKAKYSPNHIINDALIIRKTAEALKKFGHDVTIYSEESIETNDIHEDLIFSMAQGLAGIKRVQEFESRGAVVVNTPSSALNTHRIQMASLLMKAQVPFPKSIVVETNSMKDDYFKIFGVKKLWLKRGDVHAEHKEDVTPVYSQDELETTLIEFERREISKAIIQQHLPGDSVKYYGVKGTGFFYWYYMNGDHNGESEAEFDQNKLKDLAFNSADVLGLEIFGGDAIISPEGSISVIDVNDWPTFAPVRDEAAEHIAQIIHQKALKHAYQC